MKVILFFIAVIFLTITTVKADSLPNELTDRLTDVIRKNCPEAVIEVKDGVFKAKHGTLMFTLHKHWKSGEILPETYQEEGPNFKGFVLTVRFEKGRYAGAVRGSPDLPGPYYLTFFDHPPTEDGKGYYRIHFAFGSRLDRELKQAIHDALPKSR